MNRLRLAVCALLVPLVALTTVPGQALAYEGGLDPSFSGDGVVDVGRADFATMAPWGDGDVVVTSRGTRRGLSVSLLAYSASGDPDTSFSSDGVAMPQVLQDQVVADVQTDSKGRILVLTGAAQRPLLFRFTPSGALDRTFAANGKAVLGGRNDFPEAFTIDSVGRVVAVVTHTHKTGSLKTDARLVRLRPTGRLDRDWGNGGTVDIDRARRDLYEHIAVDKQDRPVLAGGTESATKLVTVLRLTEARGRLDASFSGNGVATVEVGKGAYVTALRATPAIRLGAIRSDWRALAFGLTNRGVVDGAYGSNGVIKFPTVDRRLVFPVSFDASGTVIASGSDAVTRKISTPVIAGRLSTGAADTGLGTGGAASLAVGTDMAQAQQVALVGHKILTLVVSSLSDGSKPSYQLVRLGSP